MSEWWCKNSSNSHKCTFNLCTKTQKCYFQKSMCIMKFCIFACQTLCWWGMKGHISNDSKRSQNDTLAQCNNAIGRLQTGATPQAVARHFGISRQTISDLWARYTTTQSVNNWPRSGHLRVTTVVQDRYIRVLIFKTEPQQPQRQIPRLHRISYQTLVIG